MNDETTEELRCGRVRMSRKLCRRDAGGVLHRFAFSKVSRTRSRLRLAAFTSLMAAAILWGVVAPARTADAGVTTFDTYVSFAAAAAPSLVREDWAGIPHGVIEDQTINGILYTHVDLFGHQLSLGNGGGWGFRLGVTLANGVSNFDYSDRITMTFSGPGLTDFGVNFVQGNYSSSGTSVFALQIDGGPTYLRSIPVTTFGANAGYLGISGLSSAKSVTIWQVGSGGDSVWSALHVDYAVVPGPGVLVIVAGCKIAGLSRRRRCVAVG
jgi:hypothetical protein